MTLECRKQLFSAIFVLIVLIGLSAGVAAVDYPPHSGFVNDFANILDQKTKAELELITDGLRQRQGVELAVVTISTTEPVDLKQYSTGLFNHWGVGGPEDSGLMILLAVAQGVEVETGYGIEGALPDGLVGAVIDQEGMPHFKNGEYATGLLNMSRAYANILAGEKFQIKEDSRGSGWLPAFIIFMMIVFLINRSRRYPPGGTSGGSGGGGYRGPVIIPRTTTRGGLGGGRSGGFGGGRSGGGGAGRRF